MVESDGRYVYMEYGDCAVTLVTSKSMLEIERYANRRREKFYVDYSQRISENAAVIGSGRFHGAE